MRLAPAVALFCLPAVLASEMAWAAAAGPPVDRFSRSWAAAPVGALTPLDRSSRERVVAVHLAPVARGLLSDALRSAVDATSRRDVAIDEMASAWDPARQTALEDLRDAQRRYAIAAGGDVDARGASFAALLRQVVDGSGRSVAQDGRDPDKDLGLVYDQVIRDAPDTVLPKIEASETVWTAYRDAFTRFAITMDRPDAAGTIRAVLDRQRAEDLRSQAGK